MLNGRLILGGEFLECSGFEGSRAVVNSLNSDFVARPIVNTRSMTESRECIIQFSVVRNCAADLSLIVEATRLWMFQFRSPCRQSFLSGGFRHFCDEKGAGSKSHFFGKFIAGIANTNNCAG